MTRFVRSRAHPSFLFHSYSDPVDISPYYLYRTRLYTRRVTTEERRYAGSHLADLDCTSYRGPSTSGESLHRLFTLSDGGDDETFLCRSRPFFGTAQIPIL